MEKLNLTLLKRARYRKGMSVAAAGKAIGKNRTAIWRYESGKSDITVRTLCNLLNVYNASVTDVFTEDHGGI